jgi:hypothetical protein
VHRLGRIEGELEDEVPAVGVADDVRPLDAEVAHQRETVRLSITS